MVNQLKVFPNAFRQRNPTALYSGVSNSNVRAMVEYQLWWSQVGDGVDVAVDSGKVLLTGTVASAESAKQAHRIAASTLGVIEVDASLVVRSGENRRPGLHRDRRSRGGNRQDPVLRVPRGHPHRAGSPQSRAAGIGRPTRFDLPQRR